MQLLNGMAFLTNDMPAGSGTLGCIECDGSSQARAHFEAHETAPQNPRDYGVFVS